METDGFSLSSGHKTGHKSGLGAFAVMVDVVAHEFLNINHSFIGQSKMRTRFLA